MKSITLLLLGATGGLAQTNDLPPGVLFISQATRHIRDSITAVPDYTCLETIEREQLNPPARAFRRLDLVRVEVGKVGGKELFSWPGASKFEERPISDFVAGGLIGNGAWSLFADDLFVGRVASMKFSGPEQLQGRPAVRVDYAVGSLKSKFVLRTASGVGEVSYAGSWWVDPQSMDLIRLDIIADSPPPQLQLSSARMSIEYRTQTLGERTVTLAQSSSLEFVSLSGEVSRNRIDFTNCRQFGGEAKMIVDSSDTAPQAALPPSGGSFSLRAGLSMPLELITAINIRTASVGDAITARVQSDVKDKRRTLLAKGALVHGRIRRLERRTTNTEYVLLAIEFSDVEAGHDTAAFMAQLENVEPFPGLEYQHKQKNQTVKIVRPSGVGNGGTVTTTIHETFDNELPGVGYLYLTAAPFRLPSNLRMVWKTL